MIWLILAVLIWGIIHSLTASLGLKAWIRNVMGEKIMRFYRFFYNGFSVLSFIPILWLMIVLPDQVIYRITPPWLFLSFFGQVVAGVCLIVGLLQTGMLSFLGLRQIFNRVERSPRMITHGLYRWVRHPLYTAGLLFIWLTPIVSLNVLIVFTALTFYIIVGAFFEEGRLQREFGDRYLDYKATTPMLVPGLILRRKTDNTYTRKDNSPKV